MIIDLGFKDADGKHSFGLVETKLRVLIRYSFHAEFVRLLCLIARSCFLSQSAPLVLNHRPKLVETVK